MLRDEILRLRNEGHSYRSIVATLGCSKGTVSYHCGHEQKAKTRRRLVAHRKQAHPLMRKLHQFISPTRGPRRRHKRPEAQKVLYAKLVEFFRSYATGRRRYVGMEFTLDQLLEKIGPTPTCALTGRLIDLADRRAYALDHIIPRSRGGDNSLDNCQIVCREANQAKHDMLTDDFVKLCADVVAWAQKQKRKSRVA